YYTFSVAAGDVNGDNRPDIVTPNYYANALGQFALAVLLNNDPVNSAVSAVSGTGVYNGTATLTATLKAGSTPLSGKTISFTLNSNAVGNATTNATGVATISNVSVSGINAGSYTNAVGASFAGDTNFIASNATGTLTV